MKVQLIKKQSIFDFTEKHARSEKSFLIWMYVLKHASWRSPNDIFQTFASADLIGRSSNRIVFNVGGNEFRLICKYQITPNAFRLYVKWIGTHVEYTKLCQENKQYTIDNF